MDDDNKNKKSRQKYEKPRLRKIELAAEEVMAVGCKGTPGAAPGAPGPTCMVRNCAGKGS